MAAEISPLLSQPWCQVCHSQRNLHRCTDCRVVHYCSFEHLAADLQRHSRLCFAVEHARKEAEWVRREQLKDWAEGHPWIPDPSAFPTNSDLLVQNRFDYVYELLRVRTSSAMEVAVHEIEDIESLYPNDHFDPELPALYLRLGRDQACYDYIKYCHNGSRRPLVSLEQAASGQPPYSIMGQSDVFEGPDDLYDTIAKKPYMLGHMISMALLKIRLLFKLRWCHNLVLLRRRLPAELLYQIRCHLITPVVVHDRKLLHDFSNGASLVSHIKNMQNHVLAALQLVHGTNKFVWPLLLQRGPREDSNIDGYDPGTEEEAKWLLLFSYDSWAETPGALELLASKICRSDPAGSRVSEIVPWA